MMIHLRPKGRGNWSVTTIEIGGARVSPMLVRVGQLLTLGGIVFRICGVRP